MADARQILPTVTKSVRMWDDKDLPGFFRDYYKMVRGSVTNDQFNQFSKLKTNDEHVRFVFGIPAAHDIDIKPYFKGKSEKEAVEKKEAGNMCFGKKNNVEALKLYSQAVVKAPVPSGKYWKLIKECADPKKMTLYAICLANRSAALYHLKDYRHCVKDIDEALEHHYPRELKHKLFKRKARLLSHMKQHEDARDAYRQALKWLDWAKMDRDKRIEHQNDIQKWLKLYEQGKGVKNLDFDEHSPPLDNLPDVPEVTGGRHEKYPSLSKKVDVRCDNQQGRYVVAVEDIDPGDTICAEKPAAAVLLRDMFSTHCQMCFKVVKAPIPCKKCSNVVYCSTNCRQQAYFHNTECPIQDLLVGSGMSINCFLAIRLLVQRPLEFFLSIKEKLVTEKYKEELKEQEIYDPSDFFRLYNLVSHTERRTKEDFFHRVVMVVFMVKALKKTNYFKDKGTGISDTISDTEAYIGSLLMHFLEVVQFNSHEVSEFWLMAPKTLSESKNESLGAAIYPTLALFNHSCITGQVRYFSGASAITKSIRYIPKGELVPENYGKSFTSANRADRRQYLMDRYWFECGCEACSKDWPMYQNMTNTVMNFKCRKCSGPLPVNTETFLMPVIKCEKCGDQTNIMAALKNLQNSEQTYLSAGKEMESYNLEKAESLLTENLKQLESSLHPPYKDYHQTQEAYMRVMLCKGGNYRVKAPKSEE